MAENSKSLLPPAKKIKLLIKEEDNVEERRDFMLMDKLLDMGMHHVLSKIFSYLNSDDKINAGAAFKNCNQLHTRYILELLHLTETSIGSVLLRGGACLDILDLPKLKNNWYKGSFVLERLNIDFSLCNNVTLQHVALTQEYIAVVHTEVVECDERDQRKTVIAIRLFCRKTLQLTNIINVPISYRATLHHFSVMWLENIIVFFLRHEVFFWYLDSFQVYTKPILNIEHIGYFCGSGLIAIWGKRLRDGWISKGIIMAVYETVENQKPRFLRIERSIPKSVIAIVPSSSFNSLVYKFRNLVRVQLRSKTDLSLQLICHALWNYDSFRFLVLYSFEMCYIDEFTLLLTHGNIDSYLDVWCCKHGKPVHSFAFLGKAPNAFELRVRWACDQLMAWTSNGNMTYWSVPKDLINSWRAICRSNKAQKSSGSHGVWNRNIKSRTISKPIQNINMSSLLNSCHEFDFDCFGGCWFKDKLGANKKQTTITTMKFLM